MKANKSEKKEPSIERLVTTGLINSTEFVEAIRPSWNGHVIAAKSLKPIAAWSLEFFEKYGKAPGKSIEDIFYDRKKAGDIPSNMVESIAEDLEDLADEFGQDFNVQYAVDRAQKHIRERHLEDHIDKIDDLVENGDLTAAEELAGRFTGVNGTYHSGFDDIVKTSTEFNKIKLNAPPMLLQPWLSEQSLTLIYGPRGAGKTWLCNIIATVLTRKDPDDIEPIGTWSVKHPAGVLFIDGEMNNYALQDRLRNLCRPLPEEDPKNPLYVFSGHEYSNTHDRQLNLDRDTRKAIYEHLRSKDDIKLVVLDNASALFPGLDENSKQDWDQVNQWLISLRHLGKSVILVHHASKEGKQRGTSGREDAMDTIISVDFHKDYDQNTDNAWFTMKFTKSRNMKPGASKKDFSIRIVDHPDGGLTWEQDDDGEFSDQTREIVVDILSENGSMAEIGKRHGVSKQYAHKLKTGMCVNKGWIKKEKNGKYKVTDEGLEYADTM